MQKLKSSDRRKFASVWDAIADTPQLAARMRVRSDLIMSLTEVIRVFGDNYFGRLTTTILAG